MRYYNVVYHYPDALAMVMMATLYTYHKDHYNKQYGSCIPVLHWHATVYNHAVNTVHCLQYARTGHIYSSKLYSPRDLGSCTLDTRC